MAKNDIFRGKISYFINYHCVKSARIRSFSVPYFPTFGLNTERYLVIYKLKRGQNIQALPFLSINNGLHPLNLVTS